MAKGHPPRLERKPLSSLDDLSTQRPQHDYLMHSILMIAAAHLHHLEPANETHREAETFHLSRASRGLRAAISAAIDPAHAVVLCGCSALLYTQAWSSRGEEYDRPAAGEARELDFLVRLGTGLKGVFLDQAVWPGVWSSAEFGDEIAFRPVVLLRECAGRTSYPLEFLEKFRGEYQSVAREGNDGDRFDVCAREFSRLVPALSVIRLGRTGVDVSHLEESLIRYLYCWPILLSTEFIELMKHGDMATSLVFYHFYAAVCAAAADKYWWALRRGSHVSGILKNMLEESGVLVVDLSSDTTL
jgi:hypothetical protein